MDIYRLLYYFFICSSLIICICNCRNLKGYRLFIILLALSILVEILCNIAKSNHWNTGLMVFYHLYIPAEYILIALFFEDFKLFPKKVLFFSVYVFPVLSLLISLFIIPYNEFPSIQYNIESILLMLLAIFGIFNLPVNENSSIYKQPLFWIFVGMFLFYSGIFIFSNTYSIIKKTDETLANTINIWINYIFNYLYYIFLSIGFLLCRKLNTK